MNHGIQTLNDLSAAWEPAIWRATWQGGVALLLAWMISRALRRAPAAVHCWVWRLTYAKLLVALLWARPVSLPVRAAPRTVTEAQTLPDVELPAMVGGDRVEAPVVHTAPIVIHPSRASLMLAAWSIGVAAGVVRLAIGWRRTRRWLRNGRPCDEPELLAVRDRLAKQFGLSRVPRVLRSSEIGGPLLLGLARPAILLPLSALDAAKVDDLRLILAHELAHVKRRDLAWDWLPAVAGALFFFHPLAWLAAREWHLWREVACDDLARGTAGASASEYGRVLLRIVNVKRPPSPAALAVGIGERAGHFKRRIRAMSDTRIWTRRRLASTGLVLGAAGLAGMVPWRLVAQEPATKPAARAHVASPATSQSTELPTPEFGRIQLPGTVTAATVELRAPVDGTLKAVTVGDGQQVKQGDRLFAFEDGRERAALDVARAHYQAAGERLDRMAKAVADKTGSNAELGEAREARDAAAAELQAAQVAMMEREVHAPINGTTTECNVVAGQYVSKGSPLTTIVGTDALKVEVDVPQQMASSVKVGQTCEVTPFHIDGATASLPAKIIYVAPRVTAETATIRVKASIDAKATDELKAGMSVMVGLDVR